MPVSAAGSVFALIGFFAPLPSAAAANPDTGVTAQQCFQAGSDDLLPCNASGALALNSHQDGMVGRDVTQPRARDGALGFVFIKLAADGSPLPSTATQWSCVRDKITGRVWEAKTTDGGPHDRNNLYTNWGDRRAGDASALVAVARAERLCGTTRWRLPTINELQSLVNYGVAYGSGPLIDSVYVPHIAAARYWSSVPTVPSDSVVNILSFEGGFTNSDLRSNFLRVLLVR
jgi:hypothetical protein